MKKIRIQPVWAPIFASVLLLQGVYAEEPETLPELDCVIEPSAIVDAGSSVPGLIEAINVDRSDMIQSGDVLARLESSVERAALQRASVQARSTANIELREESLKLGTLTEQRNAELYDIAAISKQDMEQLQSERRIAELQVKQEKHNRRVAELDYKRAKAALERLTIRSPINGVVTDKFKTVGEYVEDEPVLRVAQLDPLFIEVVVPVEHLGKVQAGMQASVTPSAGNLGDYGAIVERVDRVADAASGTFGVRLRLPNPDYSIPAGLRCKVAFNADPADPALASTAAKMPTEGEDTPPGNPNPWVLDEAALVKAASTSRPIKEQNDVKYETNLNVAETGAEGSALSEIQMPAAADTPQTAKVETVDIQASVTVETPEQLLLASEPKSAKPPASVPDPFVKELLSKALASAASTAVKSTPVPPLKSNTDRPTLAKTKAGKACYSIGPVTTERMAHQVAGQVAGQISGKSGDALSEQLRTEKSRVVKGYYVLTEASHGDAETGALLDRLNASKISDHMLIERGKHKGRVSLGYFHLHESAKNRLEKMQMSGFNASIVEHHGTTKQYWLDFTGPDHRELKSKLTSIASSATPNASLQSLECAPSVASR